MRTRTTHHNQPFRPPDAMSHEAIFRANRDRQARQVRLERLQRDIVECEMVYARWAPTASWFGTSSAASLDQAVERLTLEVLEPRRTRRELAETRIEDCLQQALAAELCDILTRRPEVWEPDELARLALVVWRCARRSPPARLG